MSGSSAGAMSEFSSSKSRAENVDGAREARETRNSESGSLETKYEKVADSQAYEATNGSLNEIKQENANAASESVDISDSRDGFFDSPEDDDSEDVKGDTEVEQSADGVDEHSESKANETSESKTVQDVTEAQESGRRSELTEEQKNLIKEETGWSDEIVDAISSMEEYEVYKKAGLVEAEIDGRPCLINPDIDMEQKDAFGRTNKERMEQGLAPLDGNGKPIELHHIGQHADSPLAELTQEQHRIDNYSILHDTKKESEIDRAAFDEERQDHWKARAEGEVK